MNIFKRLFKIGQAEANAAIDKMEDPIKLTEQGIKDMKADLAKSIEALAQVKATCIRSKNDLEMYENKAKDYQDKAMLLLKKAQTGDLDMEKAEELATNALSKKEQNTEHAARTKVEYQKLSKSVAQLEKNIQDIKHNIEKYENELKTLKARVKVSTATKKLNKEMSRIDSSGTVEMLERMKEKVAQEEALAEAYGDLADNNNSIDEEINKHIDSSKESAKSELEKMKEQLGMNEKEKKKKKDK